MDVSEVRRRLKHAIEKSKQAAAARRASVAATEREYEGFRRDVATPVFRMMASALTGEGIPFLVFTPAATVRLASDSSGEDFVELLLDTSRVPPEVIGRTSRGRGRGATLSERPVVPDKPVAEIGQEDVLAFLLSEIEPFIAR